MAKTKIEWADRVWNPTVGCTKVSQGCKFCYAERIYERFHPGQKFSTVHVIPGRLTDPLQWRKPSRVFVDSMSDLFHEDVPFDFIRQVLGVTFLCPGDTFIILTKRPKRMLEFFSSDYWKLSTPSNVWLGVSIENQETADERIPLLLKTPATIQFVSCEPLLGPVDLSIHLHRWEGNERIIPALGWVICGGESGPQARPMHPDWARSLKDQCQSTGVPFFMKQMGGWPNKKDKMEDLPIDLQIRSYPK